MTNENKPRPFLPTYSYEHNGGYRTFILLDDHQRFLTALELENARLKEALEFYAHLDSWRDVFAGAQLPMNLRKCAEIAHDDLEICEYSPGYNNYVGGKRARAALASAKKGSK